MSIFDDLPDIRNLEMFVEPYKARFKPSKIFEPVDTEFKESWEQNWLGLIDDPSTRSLYYPSSSLSDLTPLWQFANIQDNSLDIELPELYIFTALPPIYFPEHEKIGAKYNSLLFNDFSANFPKIFRALNTQKPLLLSQNNFELYIEEVIPLKILDRVERYNNNYNEFTVPDEALSCALTIKITHIHNEVKPSFARVLFLQLENQNFINELSHVFNIQLMAAFNPGWANHFSHTLINKFEEWVSPTFKPKYLVRRDRIREFDYDNNRKANEVLPSQKIENIEHTKSFNGYDLFEVVYR